MSDSLTPWTVANQAPLSSIISQSLLKFHLNVEFEHEMDSCPLSPCCCLTISPSAAPFSFCLQSFPALGSFPRNWLIRWPKHWSFSFRNSPSNENSGLLFFRIDWFDIFALQGSLKSLLQHHNSKVSILQRSAFVMIQLSYPWLPGQAKGIESACSAGDLGSVPEWGRFPGEVNGNPLQYSCLENSMDRGAWQATVHGVTKSQTQLSS